MRQWRVGTLSMGLVLIGSGIGFLYSNFNNSAVADAILNWWPLIFIILGIEVLCLSLFRKDENPRIKYDIFSIFIVLLIIGCGMGLQTLTELGIKEQIIYTVSSKEYELRTANSDISLKPEVDKIVIEAPRCGLNIFTANRQTITSFGRAWVTAESKENARSILEQETGLVSYISGKTQYISFNLPGAGHDFGNRSHMIDYTIIVPQNIEIEIYNKGSDIALRPEMIENDWIIDGHGSIDISLSNPVDLEVCALVSSDCEIDGNAPWIVSDLNKQAPIENQDNLQKEAQVKIGNGVHKMKIVNSNHITLNQL